MSSLNNSRGQLGHRPNGQVLTSSTGAAAPKRDETADDGAVPLSGTIQGTYPRPALPPPLPSVQRGPAKVGADSLSAPQTPPRAGRRNDASALQLNSHTSRASSTHSSGTPQHPQSAARPRSATPDGATANSTLNSAVARRPLMSQQNQSSVNNNSAVLRQPSPATSTSPQRQQQPQSRTTFAKSSRAASQKAASTHHRSESSGGGSSSGDKKHDEEHVEELIDIPLTRAQPIEKFFIEFNPADADRIDDGQPRNDNEVLLEQFAEYTDDDSFFSSSDTVIDCDPRRLRNDPLRQRAVVSVHKTLQLRALTNGRVPEDTAWNDESCTSWLYQIHNRDVALMHSSFFIFPARWTPRVVVYNVMHHWMMEMFIFSIILGYAIFQATWGRYTSPKNQLNKPDHILWADVFYTCLLGFEILARLFASGFIGHKRAFFRSPWHWLDTACLVMMILECTWWQYPWNFTVWRLIRTIKCFSYAPAPVRMKLLAKSLLRSTNRLIQVTICIIYFIFFFGLLGLQLFVGTLHNRCVDTLTGAVTTQVCRSVSTGQYWFYWGHHCGEFFTCQVDAFPNPHYDFRSFDDIGHAMLSVFQIMTFQDWSGLMQETNDGLAVMAFLYYAFTILICTWIVPSLFLGVFLEKMEKTSRRFVHKQLDFFERMLTEQRQRMSAMVRLRDYVERDEDGHVAQYPTYKRRHSVEQKLTAEDTTSGSSLEKTRRTVRNKKDHHRTIQSTQWTDEQRLQLQLALTRQRDIAEIAERRRRLQDATLGDLIMGEGQKGGGRARRASTTRRTSTTRDTKVRDDFALGGHVGAVQHHPADYAIGASQQSELPFAVRQEMQAEQLRFLEAYTNNTSTAKNDMYNTAVNVRANGTSSSYGVNTNAVSAEGGGTVSRKNSRAASSVRPPTSGGSRALSVLVARESAGVVPNRRVMSLRGTMSRTSSMSGRGSLRGIHASMMQQPEPLHRQDQLEIVINDPEGGDFNEAKTFMDKVNIIRNIIHMFTEGYPRIISQYLWEHRMMQYRYRLSPLSYTNKYEGEALRRLRQRRAKERREEHDELHRTGMAHLIDDDDEDEEEDYDGQTEKPWMRREGLVAGSMSPIRMARNIRENAPITVFNYIWYFFIIANAVFNASRFDTMPDYWEMGTFVAGVCFSVLFMLELLIRLLALGPGPFFTDPLIVIEATFMIISLFQLGFSRANTTAVFNWVRFLRLFRVIPVRPLRRVARVLLHSFPDMVYALIFFSMYMFMWLLIGMSFFGSRMGWINYSTSDYQTRGNFETFSHAAYAIAQAFSVNRDHWLYLSWSGMRVRGGYTIMYFIATVGVAFIFRFFFIAVMTYAWQAQQEQEDYYFMSGSSHNLHQRSRFFRLPFFDYSVWRSFKHIHGGFERRDVAPDEVYFLNEDMSRQLRLVEAKDRYYREQYDRDISEWAYTEDYDVDWDRERYGPDGALLNELQYVNIGGCLYRQPSLPATEMGTTDGGLPQHRGQLRFARHYQAVPATTYAAENTQQQQQEQQLLPIDEGSRRVMVNPLLASRHSLSPARRRGSVADSNVSRVVDSLAEERATNINISLAPRLMRLGNSRVLAAEQRNDGGAAEETQEMNELDEADFEHLLLPGPRLRYKNYIEEDGRRAFETCLDCNTHIQMPLRAPPGVAQRTPEELHAEHCHMAAVRSSQQLVLNALIGYARMQADHEVMPTKRMVEIVLGQAWSCGMLLFDTIENLSCMDLPERERSWDRMLEALELQQWLLGLHVGEEQVGRATLAYILAHQKKQEARVQEKQYRETWEDRTFFVLSPSNPLRRGITAMVNSIWFEAISLVVIYAASICLAVYTPGEDNRDFGGSYNSGKYKALHILDDIFAVIFAVEMVLKWISMGVILPVRRAYFWHLWNIFDCFIVVISLVSWGKADVFLRYLKVMRCFRILGPLRYWRWGSSSMSLVARTLWDSIPTLANVCLLMLMNYIVWAILFVSMFMNKMNYCTNTSIVNHTQCLEEHNKWMPIQRNFRNFYESLLTTVEISTGAEWIDVLYSAVDSRSQAMPQLRNRHPYLGLVFIAYYYLSHFVLFTLFISALIYCYMLAKSATEDATGTTIEHQVWLRMQGMILRLKPKVRLLPLHNPVSRFIHFVIANRWFESFMGLILLFNMVTMALQWYHMNHTQQVTLDVFQYVFIGFFTLEVILRLIAHGPRFFARWAYCWDLLMCILSYIQIGLNTTRTHQVPFNVNVLRVLRLGRILHLVNLGLPFSTHFTLFHEVLKASVAGLVSVTFIYMVAVYVFAILGLHFLGYIVPYSGNYIDGTYNNFSTFVNALIMVFRLSTLQDWATMLRASMDHGDYCARASKRCGPTNWAPVYYIPIVICFFLMLSTMYMAVILDKYIAAVRMHTSVTRLEDLRRFCKLWSKRDPNGTMWLATAALPELFEELRLPLGVCDRRNRVEVMQLLRDYNIPDHNGRVYYYEVLMPLARRVMALAFNETQDAQATGGQAPSEIAWRLSERSLGALPASFAKVESSDVTVAEQYAAALVQAAYRRDRAVRNYYIAKSELWRLGRKACDEQGVPYANYGFGSVSLAGPDPREEGQQRGFYVPKDATLANAATGRTYADPVAARIAAMRETMGARRRAGEQSPSTLLPSVYRSAISSEEKRFGPDAPGAIHRYERRDEKLERKRVQESQEREQESQEREQVERSHTNSPVRNAQDHRHDDNDDGAGSSTMEGADVNNEVDTDAPYRDGTLESQSPGQASLYHLDPMDANYQPPLGTNPEELRQEELDRRQRR